MKKIAAALGVLALGGLGGAAYFSQRAGDAVDPSPASVGQSDSAEIEQLRSASKTAQVELEEMKILLGNSNENLRESQSALDEIFSLVIARDLDGNSEHDLPEDSSGLLLNYYEEFAPSIRPTRTSRLRWLGRKTMRARSTFPSATQKPRSST